MPVITFAPAGSLIELTHSGLVQKSAQSYTLEKVDGVIYKVPGIDIVYKASVGVSTVEHKRGDVKGFSVRSRSRLNRKIAMLKKHHIPLFVTLTYGENYPSEFTQYKRDLDVFFKALARAYPDFGAVWKLEFQKRGAPHYHLMLWGVPLADRQFIVRTWYRIAGAGDFKVFLFHSGMLRNSQGERSEHCVQAVRSWNGVRSYASKYLSKLDDNTSRGGRIWGVRGNLPYSALVSYRVSMSEALEFRYWLAVQNEYNFKRLGFWVNDYSVEWLLFLDMIVNPPPVPWTHDIADFEFYDYSLDEIEDNVLC